MTVAEWDLRCTIGVFRTLMTRYDDGPWRDVASFNNYNDAEYVLRLIREGQRSLVRHGAEVES